jgi:hypothetical protein
MFVGFYVPSGPHTYQACAYLADHTDIPLALVKNIPKGGRAGELTPSTDLIFTRRVYIYHQDELSNVELGSLSKLYESKNLAVEFRGTQYWLLRTATTASGNSTPSPASLHYYYEQDYPNVARLNGVLPYTYPSDPPIRIEYQLYTDFDAGTKYLGFYIPWTSETYQVCERISDDYKKLLAGIEKTSQAETKGAGERPIFSKDLRFSGRIFLYHETPLFEKQKDSLTKLYRTKGAEVQFHGQDWVSWHNQPAPQAK